MLRDRPYDWPVITADQLRDARNRAGYTSQAALAKALGVSERTVTNWEAEGGHVSARSEAKVRALLWPAPGPLSSYSSYELLSELGRRLDAAAALRDDSETRDNLTSATNSAEGDTGHAEPAINCGADQPTAGWGPGPV